jgi:hypothetical protein
VFFGGGEVFLQEHFVHAVLYVQLSACPAGVYGQAFPDFRKTFGAREKARGASLGREDWDRWDIFPFPRTAAPGKWGTSRLSLTDSPYRFLTDSNPLIPINF